MEKHPNVKESWKIFWIHLLIQINIIEWVVSLPCPQSLIMVGPEMFSVILLKNKQTHTGMDKKTTALEEVHRLISHPFECFLLPSWGKANSKPQKSLHC